MFLIANAVDVSNVPTEIKILPMGNVHSQKGDFIVDDESYCLILKQFQNRNLDLVIDYEHQTLNNVQAPAGGWIKMLYKSDDAIIAKVEWTERAKEYLKNKEYKYLSPVVYCRKSDHKAVELHSVALTNTPAIDGMFPIVNSAMTDTDNNTIVGVENSETDEMMKQEEEKEPDTSGKAVLKILAELLGLPKNSDFKAIRSAIMNLLEMKDSSEKEIEKMKFEAFKSEVDDIMSYALKSGKISHAMYESSKELAMRNLECFKSYIKNAPQVVPMGKIDYAEFPASMHEGNSDINVMLGITDEEVKKYNI